MKGEVSQVELGFRVWPLLQKNRLAQHKIQNNKEKSKNHKNENNLKIHKNEQFLPSSCGTSVLLSLGMTAFDICQALESSRPYFMRCSLGRNVLVREFRESDAWTIEGIVSVIEYCRISCFVLYRAGNEDLAMYCNAYNAIFNEDFYALSGIKRPSVVYLNNNHWSLQNPGVLEALSMFETIPEDFFGEFGFGPVPKSCGTVMLLQHFGLEEIEVFCNLAHTYWYDGNRYIRDSIEDSAWTVAAVRNFVSFVGCSCVIDVFECGRKKRNVVLEGDRMFYFVLQDRHWRSVNSAALGIFEQLDDMDLLLWGYGRKKKIDVSALRKKCENISIVEPVVVVKPSYGVIEDKEDTHYKKKRGKNKDRKKERCRINKKIIEYRAASSAVDIVAHGAGVLVQKLLTTGVKLMIPSAGAFTWYLIGLHVGKSAVRENMEGIDLVTLTTMVVNAARAPKPEIVFGIVWSYMRSQVKRCHWRVLFNFMPASWKRKIMGMCGIKDVSKSHWTYKLFCRFMSTICPLIPEEAYAIDYSAASFSGSDLWKILTKSQFAKPLNTLFSALALVLIASVAGRNLNIPATQALVRHFSGTTFLDMVSQLTFAGVDFITKLFSGDGILEPITYQIQAYRFKTHLDKLDGIAVSALTKTRQYEGCSLREVQADYHTYLNSCRNAGLLPDGKIQRKSLELDAYLQAGTIQKPAILIAIGGVAGVGKSQLCEAIITMLASTFNVERSMCSIPMNSKFANPYTDQNFVIMDDAGATKPDKVSEDPFRKVLDCIQPIAAQSDQAEAQDKGKYPYRLKGVVLTSNLQTWGAEAFAAYPGAYWRRAAVNVWVEPKQPFQLNGVNYRFVIDVDAIDDKEMYFEHMFNFHLLTAVYDPNTKSFNQAPLTIDGVPVVLGTRSEFLAFVQEKANAHHARDVPVKTPICFIPFNRDGNVEAPCYRPLTVCSCADDAKRGRLESDAVTNLRLKDFDTYSAYYECAGIDIPVQLENRQAPWFRFWAASRNGQGYGGIWQKLGGDDEEEEDVENFFNPEAFDDWVTQERLNRVPRVNEAQVAEELILNEERDETAVMVMQRLAELPETYWQCRGVTFFSHQWFVECFAKGCLFTLTVCGNIKRWYDYRSYAKRLTESLKYIVAGAVTVGALALVASYFVPKRKNKRGKNGVMIASELQEELAESGLIGDARAAATTTLAQMVPSTAHRIFRIVLKGTTTSDSAHAFMIANTTILTVSHLFETFGEPIKSISILSSTWEGGWRELINIPDPKIFSVQHLKGTDLVIMQIPMTNRVQRDLTHPESAGFLGEAGKGETVYAVTYDKKLHPGIVTAVGSVTYKTTSGAVQLQSALHVSFVSSELHEDSSSFKAGDCGLPLLNYAGVLVGFLVAISDANATRCIFAHVPKITIQYKIENTLRPFYEVEDMYRIASGKIWHAEVVGPLKGVTVRFNKCNSKASVLSGHEFSMVNGERLMSPKNFDKPHVWRGKKPNSEVNEVMFQTMRALSTTIYAPISEPYSRAFADLRSNLFRCLSKFKNLVAPASLGNAIKGTYEGQKFLGVQRINLTTSAGIGLDGKKSKHVAIKGDDAFLSRELLEALKVAESSLMEGKAIQSISKVFPKDEAMRAEKVKTRLVQAGDLVSYLILKKNFWWLGHVAFCLPMEMECAFGLNPYSTEWEEMMSHMVSFGEFYNCADYSHWDLTVPRFLMKLVLDILIEFMVETGRFDHVYVTALCTTILSPAALFGNKVVFMHKGTNSGHFLTYLLNSLMNSARERYCFYSLFPNEDFSSNVKAIFGGDDSFTVSRMQEYDFQKITHFHESIGMVVTDPHKNACAKPFCSLEEISFLKRDFHGRLEIVSIEKMLMWTSSCDMMQQVPGSIRSALYEFHRWGKEPFERFVDELRKQRYLPLIGGSLSLDSFWPKIVPWMEYNSLKFIFETTLAERKENDLFRVTFMGYDSEEASPLTFFAASNSESSGKSGYVCCTSRSCAVDRFLAVRKPFQVSERWSVLEVHTHVKTFVSAESITDISKNENEQTVVLDKDSITLGTMKDIVKLDTKLISDFTAMDPILISEFLAKPVRVFSGSWTVGASFGKFLTPWEYFLGTVPVSRKLANYARLRGKPRISVLLNSNGFYFGSLAAIWTPLHTTRDLDPTRIDTEPPAAVAADFVELLQRPHLLLDPATSPTGEMILPFVYPYPYYALNAGDASTNISPGSLLIHSLNILRHANGGTDPVTVTVFFSLADAEVSVPTTYYAASERGFSIADTKATKMLGSMASMALGPYAKPAEIAFEAGSAIARHMGFSRPENTEPLAPMDLKMYGQMAVTDKNDTMEILALSTANQVAVPSECISIPNTDTDILNLSKRYSYFGTATWGIASAVDSVINSTAVTPMVTVLNDTEIHSPIISYMSKPFAYWRGTIKYKVQVFASAQHKGRLRITWDPYPTAQINNGDFFNTPYTYILDLDETREIEIEVPYFRVKPFASILPYSTPINNTAQTPTAGRDNGILNVHVLNNLVTPNTTAASSVYVNFWIAAGDDFAVFVPQNDNLAQESYFAASATFGPTTGAHVHEIVQGESVTDILALCKRETLFAYYPTGYSGDLGARVFITLTEFDKPFYYGKKGANVGRFYAGVVGQSWDLCRPNFISHFEPCFALRRGNYKSRYNVDYINTAFSHSVGGIYTISEVANKGFSITKAQDLSTTNTALNTTGPYAAAKVFWANTADGGVAATVTNHAWNGNVAARFPYYDDALAKPCGRVTNVTDANTEHGRSHTLHLRLVKATTQNNYLSNINIIRWVAAAEDYSLHFFISTPITFTVPIP